MNILELFLIAVGLSMDAFAVAISLGLSFRKSIVTKGLIVGFYFGLFQGVMPLIGYLAGSQFADKITAFDHWIAFVLLLIIGGKMIKESFEKDDGDEGMTSPKMKKMLLLSIATSIDALAVGVSFAFLNVNIGSAVAFIGITTFALSALGVLIGNSVGLRFKSKAEIFGGIILILIGTKILLEHLGIITF